MLLIAFTAAHAGVLSRDWENGKLALQLDDGVAEIEWITSTAFRYSRGAASLPVLPKIKHDPVALEFEDTRDALKLRGRYMTVVVDKATANLGKMVDLTRQKLPKAAIVITAPITINVDRLTPYFKGEELGPDTVHYMRFPPAKEAKATQDATR